MELERALRVFKQYCWVFQRDRLQAESLTLTDAERQAIRELKGIIQEYAGLFERHPREKEARAA